MFYKLEIKKKFQKEFIKAKILILFKKKGYKFPNGWFISEEYIIDECLTFMLAATMTTTLLINNGIYYLT